MAILRCAVRSVVNIDLFMASVSNRFRRCQCIFSFVVVYE
jgi:hypothetical protein